MSTHLTFMLVETENASELGTLENIWQSFIKASRKPIFMQEEGDKAESGQ